MDLTSKSKEELWSLARELEPYVGKLAPALGEGKLREAVAAGLLKQQKKVERDVEAETKNEQREKLGAQGHTKGHPSPETVAIENSPKVYATFVNMENPGGDGELGADVKFFPGEKYLFHLWDQQRHVLPKCLVDKEPEADSALLERMRTFWESCPGYSGHRALKQAKSHLHLMSLSNRAVNPRTERQFNKKEDQMVTVIVGHTPRFRFDDVEPAPANAEYGLVITDMKETVNGEHVGENTPHESAS